MPTRALLAQKASSGSIGGTVVADDSGTPLRARVWLVGAARPRLPNARGTFIFEGLAPGRYHLRATYLGFNPLDSIIRVGAGTRAQLSIRLKPIPTEISALTIRETVPPKPPPKPSKPTIACERVLIVSPRASLCVTPQMLVRTKVVQEESFLGSNMRVIEAAQLAVTGLGFVIERERQLDDRTWLIVAHERVHQADTSSVRLELEESGAHDTTVRVILTTVSWLRREQRERARGFLTRIRMDLARR